MLLPSPEGLVGKDIKLVLLSVEFWEPHCHYMLFRSLLPLEVAAGLPLNRFEDRHYPGSAVPSSFGKRFRFENSLVTILASYTKVLRH